jgi:hypothetical protein
MQLIDIAVFIFPGDAAVLGSILTAENIPHVLNNQRGSIIVPGTGAVLSIAESDKDRVVQIILEAGFGKYLIS